jgi:hypothetical protein
MLGAICAGQKWHQDKECMGFFVPKPKRMRIQPRVRPINAILSKASAVECILSRRDSAIVARHEVPGMTKKIAPSQRDD